MNRKRRLRLGSLFGVTAMMWIPVSDLNGPHADWDAKMAHVSDRHRLLARQYGFTERHLEDLENGKLIKGIVATRDRHEIALIAVTKATASRGQFLSYGNRVEDFARGRHVRAMGRIGAATLDQDLQRFGVQQDDIRAVRSCRPGDCDMKLPDMMIRQIEALAHDGDEFSDSVSSLVLGWLQSYLADYGARGNKALVVYADREQPQPMRGAIRRLLEGASVMAQEAPGLHRFLETGVLEDAEPIRQQLYWSIQDCGRRPLATIAQYAVYAPEDRPWDVWVAKKLLYANHYLQASIETVRFIEGAQEHEVSTGFIVYTQRLMFDSRLGGIKRTMVTDRLHDNLVERLQELRRELEGEGLES